MFDYFIQIKKEMIVREKDDSIYLSLLSISCIGEVSLSLTGG